MALNSFGKIIAFETQEGFPLAFHTENLELAKISNEAFVCMQKASNSGNILTDIDILEELNNWSNSNSLAEDINLKNSPKKIDHLLINSTQICNLKCVYCAAGGDGTYGDPVIKISIEKTFPQLEFFLNKLSRGDQFRINFAGGEPLLHPEAIEAIFDFANKVAQNNGIELRFVVTTNGTCFDEPTLKVLKKINAFINVSIDGPASVNDKMRPQKNGESVTAKVVEGIRRLVKEKQSFGGIGLTAVFNEMHSDVLETYEFFREFLVDWYEFNFSHTEKSKEASNHYAQSLSSVLQKAWEVGGETELLKIRSVNLLFKRLDQRQRVNNFCGIRQNLLVIDARNQYFACPWDVGNKSKIIKESEVLNNNDSIPLGFEKLPCQSCWMRNLCGGGCEFIHDNSGGIDKNFCNRMKSLIQDTFIYYERTRRV
jgi:uncharacterized protein